MSFIFAYFQPNVITILYEKYKKTPFWANFGPFLLILGQRRISIENPIMSNFYAFRCDFYFCAECQNRQMNKF